MFSRIATVSSVARTRESDVDNAVADCARVSASHVWVRCGNDSSQEAAPLTPDTALPLEKLCGMPFVTPASFSCPNGRGRSED